MSPEDIMGIVRNCRQSDGQPEATEHSTNYKGSFDLTITKTKTPLLFEEPANQPAAEDISAGDK